MKKHLPTIILVLVFLIGLSALLYPTISDYVNSIHQSRAIADYSATLKDYTETDVTEELTAADDYNAALRKTPMAFYNPKLVDGYKNLLNVKGTGIMGYISIDKIKVKLPIYHTTDESVLQVAVGHLEGTSLPVGGAGTHCVLSGHRGLPSAKLFSDLDKLEIGDTFVITVFDRKLTYRVDQIKVVLPTEVEDLQIVDGEDYCTLMTCTPYGVNSHRMLVRGTRVENAVETPDGYVVPEARQIDPIIVTSAIVALILLILLAVLLVKYRGERAKKDEKKKK
jgi:sortase A